MSILDNQLMLDEQVIDVFHEASQIRSLSLSSYEPRELEFLTNWLQGQYWNKMRDYEMRSNACQYLLDLDKYRSLGISEKFYDVLDSVAMCQAHHYSSMILRKILSYHELGIDFLNEMSEIDKGELQYYTRGHKAILIAITKGEVNCRTKLTSDVLIQSIDKPFLKDHPFYLLARELSQLGYGEDYRLVNARINKDLECFTFEDDVVSFYRDHLLDALILANAGFDVRDMLINLSSKYSYEKMNDKGLRHLELARDYVDLLKDRRVDELSYALRSLARHHESENHKLTLEYLLSVRYK